MVDYCDLLCDGNYDVIESVIEAARKETVEMLAAPLLGAWVPGVASRLLEVETLTAAQIDLLRPH